MNAFYTIATFVQNHPSIRWATAYVCFVALILGMIGVGSGCASAQVETRQYENLGNLKSVMVYDDVAKVSDECEQRAGAKYDDGSAMHGTNACSDVVRGTVRIARSASALDLLHELCHIENTLSRSLCGQLFPGGR